MQHDGYNEFRQRGRFDFPIEFHHVDCHHPRFYMPYHWHMEYEIDLVVRGTLTLSLNETQIHAQAGDIIFIRDGVVHGGRPETSDTIYGCIVFDMKKMLAGSHSFQDQIDDILKHITLISKHIPSNTPDIPKIMQYLFRSMAEEYPGYELVSPASSTHSLDSSGVTGSTIKQIPWPCGNTSASASPSSSRPSISLTRIIHNH